jgi:single-strand DNA-binding protein
MPSLNRVFLMGRCVQDPELRYTPKGVAIAEISLAVNRYRTDAEGRKSQETVLVNVALLARLAEVALKYLHKGNSAYCAGRLQLDTWEDKTTGQKRSRLYVVAEHLQLLDSRVQPAPALQPVPSPQPAMAPPRRTPPDPELSF